MNRPVRVAGTVEDDISSQLSEDAASDFWRLDITSAVEHLSTSDLWNSLPLHGGGRRMTAEGITVGAFHVFVTTDDLDARANALVVYAVDIWTEGFPNHGDSI